MDPRFNAMFEDVENQIFKVVFYPDRIYHAAYFNATRSSRYRYNVTEVRNAFDITVLKGEGPAELLMKVKRMLSERRRETGNEGFS